MQVNLNPRALNSVDAAGAVSVPVATDGRAADRIRTGAMESAVQAEFGNGKQSMTTGTYAEEVARQLDVKEINSDLDVMDPANFISQCMTGEDAHDLSEEKTPLEEYTASSLERALVRVKEQRAVKQENADVAAAKIREVEEDIREKSEEIAADARLLSEMSRTLANSELPIREGTLDDLKKAYDMALGVNAFQDASLSYMTANADTVTPKSIQDSLYGSGTAMVGRRTGTENTSDAQEVPPLAKPDETRKDGFEEVRAQIGERLSSEGMTVNGDVIDTARWLYQNDLPVTRDNIDQIDTVSALREMDSETLLNRLISEMEDGTIAENADLSNLSKDEVKDLIDRLVSTDEQTLRRTYPTPDSLATARRRLEEIRLTMTISSAREMTKLGISIDIGNLEKMVEGLRAAEQKARESLLAESSLAPTETNRERLTGTIGAAEEVLASPVELLSHTFESRQTITLQALAAEGRSLAAGYETGASSDGVAPAQRDIFKALTNTYEAVGTQVRSDLGDSIRKAFGRLDGLLDEIGLPKTPENERAVRILGYNRMEITAESVTEMKTYDNRVNNLMDAMKPQVVRRMIEEDINPLTLSLAELEDEVERIRGEVDTEDIAFSRFLWKLDKQKDITAEERESMIGVFRLLDKIEKSDGAVIGQLVQEGRDLSLKNMLEATRTRKKGHMDATISDETGSMQAVGKNTSIDAQILSAFTVSEMPALREAISPQVLRQHAGEWEDATPEELLTMCEESESETAETAPYYEEMAERVRLALEEREVQGLNFFTETEIPETIRNILSANDFVRRRMQDVRELWSEDESDSVLESFDEPDRLDEVFETIEKTHREVLQDQRDSDDISYDRIEELKQMAGHVSFYRAIRRYQMYEVPLMTDEGVLDCHVTIRDGRAGERGTVEISVDSEDLGRLQATFKLSGTRVNGFVTAENTESIEAYQSMLTDLESNLEKSGFTMDGNRLLQGNRNSLPIGNATEGAKNQDLYKVAKCFLISICGRKDA